MQKIQYFHESNLLTTVYDIVSRLPGYYFQPLAILLPHISGSGFIGTSCQSRDRVPLFTGFSIMQVWVTQPSPGYNSLRIGKFRDPGGDARYSGPLYRDPKLSFSSALASSSTPATSSSNHHQPQSCPGPAVQAGGWLLPSRRRILQSSARRGI